MKDTRKYLSEKLANNNNDNNNNKTSEQPK